MDHIAAASLNPRRSYLAVLFYPLVVFRE